MEGGEEFGRKSVSSRQLKEITFHSTVGPLTGKQGQYDREKQKA